MLPIHLAFTLFCLACQLWMAAGSTAAFSPAISNPLCPAYPPPHPGTCGPFSYNFCDSCPFQERCKSAVPTASAFTEPTISKDVYLAPEAYVYFKMLETEFMVDFAKNPMPFETLISLPYCGRAKAHKIRRDVEDPSSPILDMDERDLDKRYNVVSQIFGGKERPKRPVFHKKVSRGTIAIDTPIKGKAPTQFPRPICVPRNITIPIHFTLFATNYTTSSHVTVEVIQAQVKAMNDIYLDLGIQFYISSLNYHVGEEFRPFAQHKYDHVNSPENKKYFQYLQRMKQKNRYGKFDEINVWIVESLSAPDCEQGTFITGYCTRARSLTSDGASVDGCVINIDTLPNVRFAGLGRSNGNTLVHEIGHWLDLGHIFPEEADCGGESDGIEDTFQFPNDPNIMFDEYQPRCCYSGSGADRQFYRCGDENLTRVANYMSYSPAKGSLDNSDPLGTRPWTLGQRVHIFAAFFTMRREAPPEGFQEDCLKYPVFQDIGDPESRRWNTREFLHRRSENTTLGVIGGGNILRQASGLLETLKRVCATDPGDAYSSAINVITGDEVKCNATACEPPPGGAICPDGSRPPCVLLPDPLANQTTCPEGSPLPCHDDVCPLGTTLYCTPIDDFICPETGLKGPCKTPPNGNQNNTCPKACDVHFNKCDAKTAPTCIFPDPRVAHPRGACACAPGFKAAGAADSDATKHWRLPILGQEHRVWVPESVVCDVNCQGNGFDACKEVVMLEKSCI